MKENKTDKKDMAKKTLEILAGIAKFAETLDPASLDFSVALEEAKDCTFLLEDGFSDEAVFMIANQTTSGELYNLLEDVAKPVGEIERSITVANNKTGRSPEKEKNTDPFMQVIACSRTDCEFYYLDGQCSYGGSAIVISAAGCEAYEPSTCEDENQPA